MNESVAKSLFRNTALMMIAQMATWVTGFLLMIFLPRYLGSARYGHLYLAMSIQLICQWLIDYGGQNYVPKEVSRDRENANHLMVHSAYLRVALWVLSMVATYILCVAAHYPASVTLIVMLLATSNLWTNLTSLLRFCYQGFERMKYPSLAAVAERSFLMITVIPALLLGAQETTVVVLMATSTLLSFAICVKYARELFAFRFFFDVSVLKRMVREGMPYFLWSLFGVIYYRVDTVMLSMMTPDSVVGWYGAAYRFFDILMFLPSIYSQALYPILTKLSTSQQDSMTNVSQKSLQFLLLAGIPIAVTLIFYSRLIIQILFGLDQFGPSVIDLQIFSLGILLVYVDFVVGGTVLALDKQKQWAFVALAAAIVNIGANFILIPHFQTMSGNGGIGAAIATDVTELFIMCSGIVLLPSGILDRKLVPVIGKGLFSGICMTLCIVAGMHLNIPPVVALCIGSLAYVGTLLVTAVFEPAEMRFFLQTVSVQNLRKVFSERSSASA